MFDGCFDIRKGSGRNIWQTVKECAANFERALYLLVKD